MCLELISLLRARKLQATKQTHVGVWKELNFSSALLIVSEKSEHRLCVCGANPQRGPESLEFPCISQMNDFLQTQCLWKWVFGILNTLKCIVQWHSFCLSPFLALHTIQWKCLDRLIYLSSCHSLMSAFYSLENFHTRVFIFEFFLVM